MNHSFSPTIMVSQHTSENHSGGIRKCMCTTWILAYWGPLVFAYVFRVRVVVVTRKTVPIVPKENATDGNATEKIPRDPSATDPISVDGNSTDDKGTNEIVTEEKGKTKGNKKPTFEYHHSTKIFDFVDGFENNIDDFVPVKSYEKLFRLSDAAFYSKPTIKMLYVTGFTKKNIPDGNHFLFLRRALCVKVPPKLPISNVSLRDFIITQQSLEL
jgi:hypothetical protein